MSEESDVRAAAESLIAAYNAGDIAGVAWHWYPEETVFWEDGGMLTKFDAEHLQNMADRGFRTDVEWRQLTARVYGGTAVATGYLAGTVTSASGTQAPGPWRNSIVWVRQGGRWKMAHSHVSKLLAAAAP